MAAITVTKRQLRQMLIRLLASTRDDYWIATPSSASASSIVFSQYANERPNAHWQGGEIRAWVNGAAETRRVSAFDSSTATFTPNTNFTGTPSEVEILRALSGMTFDQLDAAIDQACMAAAADLPIEQVSTRLMSFDDAADFAVPAGWVWLCEVWADWRQGTGDRFMPGRSSNRSEQGLYVSSATERLAQLIEVSLPTELATDWLALRAIGSPTGNLTLTIQETTGDMPNGTVVPNGTATTVAASSISTTRDPVPFTFAAPPILEANTKYARVLSTSGGLNASSYVAWAYDTQSTYYGGDRATYNGTAWTAADGAHLARFVDVRTDPRGFGPGDVRMVNGSVRLKPVPWLMNGVPLTLVGLASPNKPATDAAFFTGNTDPILNYARGIVMETKAAGNPQMLTEANYYKQQARDAWRRAASRSRPWGLCLRVSRQPLGVSS